MFFLYLIRLDYSSCFDRWHDVVNDRNRKSRQSLINGMKVKQDLVDQMIESLKEITKR